jgi:hypothetical protein
MRILHGVLFLLGAGAALPAPPIGVCPAGRPLAVFDIGVETTKADTNKDEANQAPASDAGSGKAGEAGNPAVFAPLRSLVRLEGGSRLIYKPREILTSSEDAEVALISIPTTATGVLGILESRKASQPAEWIIPSRAAAVALVYGPHGLNLNKVVGLVRHDPQLITQLAVYAEKSAQTEELMETLAAWERSGSSQTLEAALQGFSSRYGMALPVLNRSATTDQQALTLMRALHPTLAAFDPLAPSQAGMLQQSGSLAASVAGLFLGNPVGLATAGGAMFLNLRSLLFPGSEFRSALAQQSGGASVLCAKREPNKSRTRLVYLWAWKLPGLPAPRLEGLPYRVNLGPPLLRVPLKGVNLENIRGVTTNLEEAEVELLSGEPALSLKLPPSVGKGARLDLRFEVEDAPAPIVLPGAIELLGPRPVVDSAAASLPQGLPMQLTHGEIPANAFTAVTIRAANVDALPTLHLDCTDPSLTLKKLSIRPGEQAGNARLRTLGKGELFLSFEPAAVGQPPCELGARIETSDGLSDSFVVGRLVRLPRIEKFSLTPELVAESTYSGWIEGEELEAIEMTGWHEAKGVPVAGPPLPVANSGSRQRLKIAMPWPPPAPQAPLYVWLRGEPAGRRTTVAY